MSETDPLLAAVEALTKPQKRRQEQDIISRYVTTDDDGIETVTEHVVGTQKVTVELPPLLDMLDDAIQSSMGGSTKGAALASESAVLNVHALYEAMKISSAVRDWCRMAGVLDRKHTRENLEAWNASVYVRDLDEEHAAFFAAVMQKWAASIRTMLDPWREKDLPNPCPVCHAEEWWDASEDKPGEPRRRLPPMEGIRRGRPRPLLIRYKRDDPEMIEKGHAICRACGAEFGLRELQFELEQAEATTRQEGMTTV
ncbi:hypothetical protein P5G50_18420 [Leifsonia sp. F6_8S_P_1B]|uniref:DUF7341 domain-containing protein n=1 Tax=Leifsonia williamsii TaxID=3035919 RepID=A0ABT8KIX5_9MICO|nr:hypothetical protein [Leifsonia williamsii]MDN4616427.1 hypothetical protein [Leifsonia williamsii]